LELASPCISAEILVLVVDDLAGFSFKAENSRVAGAIAMVASSSLLEIY